MQRNHSVKYRRPYRLQRPEKFYMFIIRLLRLCLRHRTNTEREFHNFHINIKRIFISATPYTRDSTMQDCLIPVIYLDIDLPFDFLCLHIVRFIFLSQEAFLFSLLHVYKVKLKLFTRNWNFKTKSKQIIFYTTVTLHATRSGVC